MAAEAAGFKQVTLLYCTLGAASACVSLSRCPIMGHIFSKCCDGDKYAAPSCREGTPETGSVPRKSGCRNSLRSSPLKAGKRKTGYTASRGNRQRPVTPREAGMPICRALRSDPEDDAATAYARRAFQQGWYHGPFVPYGRKGFLLFQGNCAEGEKTT